MSDQIHCRTFSEAVACLRQRGYKLGRISRNKFKQCFVIEAARVSRLGKPSFTLFVW
jgi:hypothetical protein